MAADHPQTDSGRVIVFDHKTGGNEWWVEVILGGQDAGAVATLDAMDYAGPWVAMQKTAYGSWSASFHIEPGNPVKFRATWAGGAEQRSCWFSHPQGVEACGTSPPAPPPTSGFDATFTLVTGNGNWVQSQVTPNSGFTVATVDVRLSDGAWKPLKLQSWGVRAWAASYPIPEGSVVQMRATATTGASDLSECYRWIPPQGNNGENAATVACGSTPPPGATWQTSELGTVGPTGTHSDSAVGDGDGSGRNSVYIPGGPGLFQFKWNGTGWDRSPLSTRVDWTHVTVGDGDRDGKPEVYASQANQVSRFSWTGTAWTSSPIASFTAEFRHWTGSEWVTSTEPAPVSTMSLGDADHDGKTDLYIGLHAYQGTVHQLRFVGGAWQDAAIASLGGPTGGTANTMWIGDGDRDGESEIYVGSAYKGSDAAWRIKWTGSAWTTTRLGIPGENSGLSGIVAGDGDRDGLGEVYATSMSQAASVYRFTTTPQGWQMERIANLPDSAYGTDLFLGDADNDGTNELYASALNGHLYQVRWTGTTWAVTEMADLTTRYADSVVVGDGDNDGKRETYVTVAVPSPAGEQAVTYRDVRRVADRPSPSTPPPGNFGATFTMVQGNVWWEQAQVTPSGEALSKVDVSLNGGAWQPLKLQTWGVREYAGSYHAVQGTIVQLRATSTTGSTALSSCYQWIPVSGQDASQVACGSTPPPPPPPSGFDATFSSVKGNDWWVQANVAANQPLAGVDVRVNCAPSWKPLTKQSWGGWTASFNIPAGSKVDFAARSTSGSADASGGYTWPQATATPGCAFGVWPQEGSFATYNIHHNVGGGGENFVTDARLNLAYNNGAWSGICTGRSTRFGSGDGTTTDWTDTVNGQPPMKLPAATNVGATHNLAYFFPSYDGHNCDLDTNSDSDFRPVTVRRQEDRATSLQDSNGASITLRAWYADEPVDAERRYVAAWDTKLGLVLDWNVSGRGSHGGELVATDAPMR